MGVKAVFGTESKTGASGTADVLIIFHSQTGNTERLAKAVARGVDETANARAYLKWAADTLAQDLRNCSAVVICSPEYFGYMAGAVKDFFDSSVRARSRKRCWRDASSSAAPSPRASTREYSSVF